MRRGVRWYHSVHKAPLAEDQVVLGTRRRSPCGPSHSFSRIGNKYAAHAHIKAPSPDREARHDWAAMAISINLASMHRSVRMRCLPAPVLEP